VRRARKPVALVRRGLLVVVLIGAAVIPGRASSEQAQHCTGLHCQRAGSVLWTHTLSGSWLAEPGEAGTVPSQNEAYAAAGGGVAVIGTGTTVTAFLEKSGDQLWQVSLSDIPAGAGIVGVRAFDGAVAVGVEPDGGPTAGRDEVILSAATGGEIRTYRAAPYGGAIEASPTSAVIVRSHAVTDYSNATGRVLWSRAIGPDERTWRVSGQDIYVEAGGGKGRAAKVMVLRRISLRNGAERVIRASGRSGFAGTLSEVVDGDVLFATDDGVQAYDGTTGRSLWFRQSADVELAESGQSTAYLASGNGLIGVDVLTDQVVSRAPVSVASSLYWVSGDVALGLDENALGEAWGYNLATRRVVWSTPSLPWPHFFVDLSGLGGSANPGSKVMLLASCGRVGPAGAGSSQPACLRPELVAVLA
jgi:PQQ-like domain